MKTQRWRVMGIDADGYPNEETNDLSFEEATEEMQRYQNLWTDTQFYIEPYEHTEPEPERHYNENAVDGWEDIYPDRDY